MKPIKSLLLITCVVSSCNVGPRFVKPQPKMPDDFASRANAAHAAEVDATWWRKLNDSTLNELVAQADRKSVV